ncbi:MAG: Crp/Fnr family transcriptional regulator [Aureispira sp.]
MNSIAALADKIEEQNLWHKELHLSRNEYLKMADSTDTNLYFIVSGSVHIFVEQEERLHTIRLGYEGNFIGALDSFITEKASPFYIQTIKKTHFKVISKTAFMELVQSSQELFALWYTILEQLVYQQIEREKDLLLDAPRARYERVWNRSPQLFQHIPHKYIASYLRMTPETFSRIKKTKS